MPEELSAHRVNVMYVDRILDILKARQLHRSLDRDRLLIESLQTVVQFLVEKGETDCARVLGEHLETLGNRVKRIWKLSDSLPNWHTAMPKSAPPSPAPSPPSAKTACRSVIKGKTNR
ncbi:MAG: hypothetical protein KC553_04385 [Nitrospina sp.]|nr:hypothetical protein [Nitrospina sp.]